MNVFRDEKSFACALDALARRDFAGAEAELGALLSAIGLSDADRAFLLNKRGVARIGLERRADARADFQAALEINPNFAPAFANLGNLLFEEGEAEAAIVHYERAIRADPDYAIAHFNLGVAYKRVGRIADGVRALRRAQRLEGRANAAGFWQRARRR